MTEAQCIEIVSQRFLDRWPIEAPGVAYSLDGEPKPTDATFALCSIQHTTSKRLTLGRTPRWEHSGLIKVKTWTPAVHAGRAPATTLGDAARRVFQGRELSVDPLTEGMLIGEGETQYSGVDGNWYMQMIVFEFRRYEQTTSA